MLRSLLFAQCFSNSSLSDLPKSKNHKFSSRHVLRKNRKNFEDKKFLFNGYLAQLLDKSIPVAFNSTLWREKAFIRDRITARKGEESYLKNTDSGHDCLLRYVVQEIPGENSSKFKARWVKWNRSEFLFATSNDEQSAKASVVTFVRSETRPDPLSMLSFFQFASPSWLYFFFLPN